MTQANNCLIYCLKVYLILGSICSAYSINLPGKTTNGKDLVLNDFSIELNNSGPISFVSLPDKKSLILEHFKHEVRKTGGDRVGGVSANGKNESPSIFSREDISGSGFLNYSSTLVIAN